MNKHELCVYYLFKETFTISRISKGTYSFCKRLAAFLKPLLEECEKDIAAYEEYSGETK